MFYPSQKFFLTLALIISENLNVHTYLFGFVYKVQKFLTYLLMFTLLGEGDTSKSIYLQNFNYITNICVAFLQKFFRLIHFQLNKICYIKIYIHIYLVREEVTVTKKEKQNIKT